MQLLRISNSWHFVLFFSLLQKAIFSNKILFSSEKSPHIFPDLIWIYCFLKRLLCSIRQKFFNYCSWIHQKLLAFSVSSSCRNTKVKILIHAIFENLTFCTAMYKEVSNSVLKLYGYWSNSSSKTRTNIE